MLLQCLHGMQWPVIIHFMRTTSTEILLDFRNNEYLCFTFGSKHGNMTTESVDWITLWDSIIQCMLNEITHPEIIFNIAAILVTLFVHCPTCFVLHIVYCLCSPRQTNIANSRSVESIVALPVWLNFLFFDVGSYTTSFECFIFEKMNLQTSERRVLKVNALFVTNLCKVEN